MAVFEKSYREDCFPCSIILFLEGMYMRICYSRKKVARYLVTSAARISLFFGQAHATSECFTAHYANVSFFRLNSSFNLGYTRSFGFLVDQVLGYILVIFLESIVVQLPPTRKVMCIKTINRNYECKYGQIREFHARFTCQPLRISTSGLTLLTLSTRSLITPTITLAPPKTSY